MSTETGVRVCVRFRPQQQRELVKAGVPVCHFDSSNKNVTMNGKRKAAFSFDRVFNMDTTQQEVYDYAAKPVVEDLLKGYNGTIFAYGQTSSGKTHTMEGPDIDDKENKGVIPRIIENIFDYIDDAPYELEFQMRVSYFEIYLEKIRDLLCDHNNNLQIQENKARGIYVRHATEAWVESTEDVLAVMKDGKNRRMVASTGMNDQSSRSHAVMLLEVTQKNTEKGGSKTGKMYMVDLAGSEKVSKTGAQGGVLEEAKNINKSLSALGLVIMSLTEGSSKKHIPYRDSKLTRILQDSLGGNSKTTIIICCSPSSYNEDESLSSLYFGKRAKKIKNKAKVNVEYSAAELTRQLDVARAEISKLGKRIEMYEAELKVWRGGGTVSEEDRVNLLADGAESGRKPSMLDEIKKEEQIMAASPGPGGGGGAGLSDAERETFMQRESELLDLLDDKDEEIHQLEREVDQLATEKVTITKLAAENMHHQQQLKELDKHLDAVQEDNAMFEMTIEELVNTNGTITEERARLKAENEELGKSMGSKDNTYKSQLNSVGDMINALCTTKSGRTLPPTPGLSGGNQTIVDKQLQKARTFIGTIQSDVNRLAAENSLKDKIAEDYKEKISSLQQKLSENALALAQAGKSLSAAEKERQESENKIADLDGSKQELEEQITKLIEKMIESELVNESQKAQSQKDIDHTSESKSMLEQQYTIQNRDLARLKTELEGTKDKLVTMSKAKDKMEQELLQESNSKDKLASSLDDLKSKILELQEAQLKALNEARSSQSFRDDTGNEMMKVQVMKKTFTEALQKKQAQLLANMEARKAAQRDAAGNPASERPIDRFASQLKTKNEEARRLQDEVRLLKQRVEAKNKRILTFETMYKDIQTKFAAHMAKPKEREQVSLARRNSLERRERHRRGSPPKTMRGGQKPRDGGKKSIPRRDKGAESGNRWNDVDGGATRPEGEADQPPTYKQLDGDHDPEKVEYV